MAPPFKDRIAAAAVHALMRHLAAVHPSYDTEAATAAALRGLTDLELKPRIAHVAEAIAVGFGGEPWPERARAAACAATAGARAGELDEFRAWPLARFVEVHGIDDLDSSFAALEEITPVASAEFAVRPFIDRYRDAAMSRILEWTSHPSEQVRRLASEGTRPLLPWAPRIAWYVDVPRITEPILHRLVDDPSPYVRRSVANHLGDIAKLDVGRALQLAEAWLDEHPGSVRLVAHGLRHPIKAGHPNALRRASLGRRAPSSSSDGIQCGRSRCAPTDPVHTGSRSR